MAFLRLVKYLVEQGADKDKADHQGWTPLLVAAQEDHIMVVQCLVEHGADKDKANDDGLTPLRIAQVKGHVEMAAYLRAAGAR